MKSELFLVIAKKLLEQDEVISIGGDDIKKEDVSLGAITCLVGKDKIVSILFELPDDVDLAEAKLVTPDKEGVITMLQKVSIFGDDSSNDVPADGEGGDKDE